MALTCAICSAVCKKTDTIVCMLCNYYQHISCLTKQTPPLNPSALENIMKTKPSFSFGCNACFNKSCLNPVTSKMEAVEKQLLDLTNIIKGSVTMQLDNIKSDLTTTLENNKRFEKETNSKIEKLEDENNYLRRQLNRSDIIVSGLPAHQSADLYSMAISIAKACEVNIVEFDINSCVWIRNKSSLLIKLNNTFKRDLIMKNYKRKYNLTLKDVIQTETDKRIYLNDYLTPSEAKVHYICRGKLKSSEIRSYRIIYTNPVSVKLVYPNKKEIILSIMDLTNNHHEGHNV